MTQDEYRIFSVIFDEAVTMHERKHPMVRSTIHDILYANIDPQVDCSVCHHLAEADYALDQQPQSADAPL